MKQVAILGSTGSIGRQTLEVIRQTPGEYEVTGLAARANVGLLCEQALEFRPQAVAISDELQRRELEQRLSGSGIEILSGSSGVTDLAATIPATIVVAAIVGTAGLLPTMAALAAGRQVALANKEVLVACGHLLEKEAIAREQMIPVDSEHSAIFQCIQGYKPSAVDRIWLTASGGPFRTWSAEKIATATPNQALQHPRWQMGPKITIDSATMMNKGLEMIEAKWLFGLTWDQIEVVIHPQSIVHSMVEFVDGSMLAQLSPPDMRLPIVIALTYPDRVPFLLPRLDLKSKFVLEFEPPDERRFPCLTIARECGQAGGLAPAVMNAANEEAVGLFLAGAIGFGQIATVVRQVVDRHDPVSVPDLQQVLGADLWARTEARKQVDAGV